MAVVLEWLEATGIATWVREGETLWAFPMVLTLHTFGLGLLAGTSAVVDLRLLGAGRSIPLAHLETLFGVMWVGFWFNALTGALLFAADARATGTSVLFLAKLACVALGVTMLVLLRRRLRDIKEVSDERSLRPLAVVSLLAWTAAITAGRVLAYV